MTEKELQDALKNALKSGDKVSMSALRLLISEIKYRKIEDLVKGELAEDKILGVLNKMMKRYKESIEQFSAGGRQDLVEKEKAEMAVLVKYIPAQMSDEEALAIVVSAIQETGAASIKDMGKVMKLTLERAKGRADGSMVSRIVKEKLS
jgi:hypothetical protein